MRAALGFALLAALLLSPAKAALTLCNRTSYVIYAATGQLSGADVVTKGWTRIVPGACADALKNDLSGQGYFLYARTARAHAGPPRDWSGHANLCVRDNDFTLPLPFGARCTADSYELAFAQIDTHHMRSWTTTFREQPDLASMQAAEGAGLRRLLADNGIKTFTDPQTNAALAALRKKLRLAEGLPALFSALETEAMKSAAPAGYTVCNDTDKPFWAAISLKKGAAFVSRGWWTVAGGSCSHLITEPIAGAKIWLRVERDKGSPLVAGPETFCTTAIAFEIQGRDNCAKRGLTGSGFTETNSRGLPGFSAHVAGGGLSGK